MAQPPQGTSHVRLRALSGRPLADPKVKGMVVASAQALAEREGLAVLALHAADDALEVTLATDKLAAMGFLAELRRNTNAWYENKYQCGPLWGTSVREDDEPSDG
ncbi:MAG TPA: hypothetical protein VHN77_14600 [Phycisphaerales bacterium]|nr:hypothetical protein [Phycisphaerales bacterium]